MKELNYFGTNYLLEVRNTLSLNDFKMIFTTNPVSRGHFRTNPVSRGHFTTNPVSWGHFTTHVRKMGGRQHLPSFQFFNKE